MLVFGHTGITLGAAAVLAGIVNSGRLPEAAQNQATDSPPRSSRPIPALNNFPRDKVSWFTSLGSYIDIRLLLIGSLLPDIIDKPIGQFFFKETFSNGRIFCHTLLFLIIIILIGLYLYRRRSTTWLLVLSFGTFTHLVCDLMWRSPRTLLWPIYGLAFERLDLIDWMPRMLHMLVTDPRVYVPELVGAVILIWFAVGLVRGRKAFAFVKYGQV